MNKMFVIKPYICKKTSERVYFVMSAGRLGRPSRSAGNCVARPRSLPATDVRLYQVSGDCAGARTPRAAHARRAAGRPAPVETAAGLAAGRAR